MRASRLVLVLPLVLFAGLSGVFAWRVVDGEDRAAIPSALLGRPAPETVFPPLLDDAPGVDPADFLGRVTLVNVFASWCAPCRVEHPQLMALSGTPGLTLAGVNYKDGVVAARDFLEELGDPYDAIGVDPDGRRAIEWGLTGVPETYLVGPDGVVVAKHVGVLSEAVMEGDFGTALGRLLDDAPAAGS
ncbi:DsbE family thiol:disulfide interchange protein [Acuticoccus sp.]|uniref:DsbE family thiol:disulfide interchange protein n=1 Tax=Acuticoccus sp. TaxID=1904378 RepID=UPI003B5302DA